MITNGGSNQRISTDGIDYLLESINRPDKSAAFFVRQDGHLFYVLTFFDASDNVSLMYDFNAQLFFHLSDENLNYFPVRQTIYFNDKTYFVSINDGSIYELSTDYTTYNYNVDPNRQGEMIPRKRICKSVRKTDNERFRAGLFSFWLEQGETDIPLLNIDSGVICDGLLITEEGDQMISESGDNLITQDAVCAPNLNRNAVDLSFSKNGNASFSNRVRNWLNAEGVYQNQIEWHRLGQANEMTLQLEFWGLQRFVAQNGVLEIY
jgi:hypothetical protein